MKFTIDGNEYRIRYFHVNTDRTNNHALAGENLKWLQQHRKRAMTTCTIDRVIPVMPTADGLERPDTFFTVATGEAICSRSDTFNKATGRELSLTRALYEMFENPDKWYLLGRILVAITPVGQHLISMGKFPK